MHEDLQISYKQSSSPTKNFCVAKAFRIIFQKVLKKEIERKEKNGKTLQN